MSSISISWPGLPDCREVEERGPLRTRAACCMLWVTMTIVYWSLSVWMRSSIASVEIGSSAEHGSSISSTWGSTAIARAMHRRCCWPPDRPAPGLSRRSLTSSQRFAPFSELLDDVVQIGSWACACLELQAGGDVVVDRHRRERVGPLEHHADRAADVDRVDAGAVDVVAVEQDLALHVRAGDDLVHAVERAQEGGLAAARRADEGRDRARLDGQVARR